MKSKFYIIYEDYTEYNQFEGSWDVRFQGFINLELALKWLESHKNSNDIKNIIGPLIEFKT